MSNNLRTVFILIFAYAAVPVFMPFPTLRIAAVYSFLCPFRCSGQLQYTLSHALFDAPDSFRIMPNARFSNGTAFWGAPSRRTNNPAQSFPL